jgi:hypothetical protein
MICVVWVVGYMVRGAHASILPEALNLTIGEVGTDIKEQEAGFTNEQSQIIVILLSGLFLFMCVVGVYRGVMHRSRRSNDTHGEPHEPHEG